MLSRRHMVLLLHAAGLTPEEIADILKMEANTVRKHLANGKDEVGYHKSTELAGYVLCKFLNTDFDKVKEDIISYVKTGLTATTSIILILSLTINSPIQRRIRRQMRRQEIEFVEKIATAL